MSPGQASGEKSVTNALPTGEPLPDFISNLVLQLKSLRKGSLVPSQGDNLQAVKEALQASWAVVLKEDNARWIVDYGTSNKPDLALNKLYKLLNDCKQGYKKQDKQDKHIVFENPTRVREYLAQGVEQNLALVPFAWAFQPDDIRIALIAGKKSPVGEKPLYVTPLLDFLSFWLSHTSYETEVYEKIKWERAWREWEKSLSDGSRSVILKRSEDLLEFYKSLGDGSISLDEVYASYLDSFVSSKILPPRGIRKKETEGETPEKIKPPKTGKLTLLAEMRNRAWEQFNSPSRSKGHTSVSANFTSKIKEIWENEKKHSDTTEKDQEKGIKAPHFVDATLGEALLDKLWAFARKNQLRLECLRTHLFILHYAAVKLEGIADGHSLKECDEFFRYNENPQYPGLLEGLSKLIKDFLNEWHPPDSKTKLLITSEWLLLWFGLKVIEAQLFEACAADKRHKRTPSSRAVFYRHSTAFYLYLLHIIRFFGEPSLFRYSDIQEGYEGFVDATLYLLAEYAHEYAGLSRHHAPLYQIMGKLWASEALLYTVRENYRDHFHHIINVCLLGMVFLEAGMYDKLQIDTKSPSKEEKQRRLRNWMLSGLLHDVSFSIDLHKHLLPHLEFITIAPFLKEYSSELSASYESAENKLLENVKQWCRFAPSKGALDHGIVSALFLLFLERIGSKEEGKTPSEAWQKDIYQAFEAIGKHNLDEARINPQENPLAFILALSDVLQEWDRPRTDAGKLRRSIDTSLHRLRENIGSTNRALRYLTTNLEWKEEGCVAKLEDELTLKLLFYNAKKENLEPAAIWYSNTQTLQRLLFDKAAVPFKVQLTAINPSSKAAARDYFLEMDLFEDFLNEADDTRLLLDWVKAARSNGNWLAYKHFSRCELFSWEIPITAEEEVFIKEIPSDIYNRYRDWKEDFMVKVRLKRSPK